ncbi:MAG TPA: serine peptidase [Halieaceae bacterium]|jgi:serine protease Do|uniref:Do family serine endopeptidase n=1 Tax=Haliea TaxID=475794 RepID=UPI000C52AAB2|nr:Do family serine endopeptidase [Haliea sp.]HAN68471.1 serine peptidase [Halieaceae bacterium]MAD63411.1 serine peptidase [Haliea sp.]MAY93522.1 serine peptidase [Haliea sp.]MBK41281.1 serine peptidase [Haliea sp.]MBP71838.1 serine peptidase [Haliea sp.]|tara:strand:- start:15996 stop:17396 length:1401 start_codon:yes stop_codon:yes gene_type:complete
MISSKTLSTVLFLGIALVAPGLSAQSLPDFSNIVDSGSPAVVKIIVEHPAGRAASGQPDMEQIPEYLRRFFEYRGEAPPQRQRMSMGSGFVISEDGFIVTNNHVVDGADSVLVRMIDRREFEAEVVGTDPRSDLALLRVAADGLPFLRLETGDALKVGEWVLAIGSPFGLDYSVTAGIVSAMGRSLPTEEGENYVPFIQTDVAINPGNSGGPLFNLKGEVVGVNSQIFTRSGGSIGLSFAIPASVVRNVVAQLQEQGRVTRGWLGVTIQDVDKTLAESFGLDRPQGALVAQLAEGGPAAKSGLQPGDVILRFDGKDISTSADLPHVVGLVTPGDKVSVEVMRERKRKTLRVTVGGLDADDSFALRNERGGDAGMGRLGLLVDDASPEALERLGLSGGVVVRQVAPDSVASDAGVVPGDVITMLGSTAVKDVDSFERAEKRLSAGDSVPLRLIRRGSPLFIGLKLRD